MFNTKRIFAFAMSAIMLFSSSGFSSIQANAEDKESDKAKTYYEWINSSKDEGYTDENTFVVTDTKKDVVTYKSGNRGKDIPAYLILTGQTYIDNTDVSINYTYSTQKQKDIFRLFIDDKEVVTKSGKGNGIFDTSLTRGHHIIKVVYDKDDAGSGNKDLCMVSISNPYTYSCEEGQHQFKDDPDDENSHFCTVCGISENHQYKRIENDEENGEIHYVKATCLEDGFADFICTDCGKTKHETYEKTGHSLVKRVVGHDCENAGFEEIYCENDGCDYIKSRTPLEKGEGHSIIHKVIDRNCKNPGYTRFYCSRKGCDYEEIVPFELPREHDITSTIIKEPTCTEAGSRIDKCNYDDCDYEETISIPPTLHNSKNTTYSITDDNKGKIIYTDCDNCGKSGEITFDLKDLAKYKEVNDENGSLIGYKYTLNTDFINDEISVPVYNFYAKVEKLNIVIPDEYKGYPVITVGTLPSDIKSSIKSIKIGKNIEKLPKSFLEDCSNLTDIYFTNNIIVSNRALANIGSETSKVKLHNFSPKYIHVEGLSNSYIDGGITLTKSCGISSQAFSRTHADFFNVDTTEPIIIGQNSFYNTSIKDITLPHNVYSSASPYIFTNVNNGNVKIDISISDDILSFNYIDSKEVDDESEFDKLCKEFTDNNLNNKITNLIDKSGIINISCPNANNVEIGDNIKIGKDYKVSISKANKLILGENCNVIPSYANTYLSNVKNIEIKTSKPIYISDSALLNSNNVIFSGTGKVKCIASNGLSIKGTITGIDNLSDIQFLGSSALNFTKNDADTEIVFNDLRYNAGGNNLGGVWNKLKIRNGYLTRLNGITAKSLDIETGALKMYWDDTYTPDEEFIVKCLDDHVEYMKSSNATYKDILDDDVKDFLSTTSNNNYTDFNNLTNDCYKIDTTFNLTNENLNVIDIDYPIKGLCSSSYIDDNTIDGLFSIYNPNNSKTYEKISSKRGIIYTTRPCTVKDFNGNFDVLNSTLNGIIPESFFKGCTFIGKLNISNITGIEDSAFKNCTFADGTTFDFSKVTFIGDDTFSSSNIGDVIKEITMPNLEKVGTNAFSDSNIRDFDFSNTKLVSIGEDAFTNCYTAKDSSKYIKLPTTLTSIPTAFLKNATMVEDLNCVNVKSVQNPLSESFPNLKKLTIDGNATVKSNKPMLYNMTNIEELLLTGTVENGVIASGYASGCTKLKKVTLCKGIRRLAPACFAGSGLESIDLPDGLEEIDTNAFSGTAVKELFIPKTVTTIATQFAAGTYQLTSLIFENSDENTAIKSLDLNAGVFAGIVNLEELRLPNRISNLTEDTLNGATSIKRLYLPHKLTNIYNDDLSNMTNLTDIYTYRYDKYNKSYIENNVTFANDVKPTIHEVYSIIYDFNDDNDTKKEDLVEYDKDFALKEYYNKKNDLHLIGWSVVKDAMLKYNFGEKVRNIVDEYKYSKTLYGVYGELIPLTLKGDYSTAQIIVAKDKNFKDLFAKCYNFDSSTQHGKLPVTNTLSGKLYIRITVDGVSDDYELDVNDSMEDLVKNGLGFEVIKEDYDDNDHYDVTDDYVQVPQQETTTLSTFKGNKYIKSIATTNTISKNSVENNATSTSETINSNNTSNSNTNIDNTSINTTTEAVSKTNTKLNIKTIKYKKNTYKIVKNKLVLVRVNSKCKTLKIPNKIKVNNKYLKVNNIDKNAFKYAKKLKTVKSNKYIKQKYINKLLTNKQK